MAATLPWTIPTSAGPVEIETYGTGFPILVLHGTPGGTDGARYMSRFLQQDQFQTICPSRPGFNGTPLPGNRASSTLDDDADVLAALLEALGVRRVGVLAWSGGGPVAYRLAVRYPNLISSMVMIATVSYQWIAPKPSITEKLVFGTGVGEKLVAYLSEKRPGHLVETALAGEGTVRGEELKELTKEVMGDENQRRLVLEIAQTMNIAGRRKPGWDHDCLNFAKITDLELNRIQCPVLLVHGDVDTDATIEHSRFAHSKLPNSTLVVMPQGTHLSFYAHPEAPQVQEQAREWLRRHS